MKTKTENQTAVIFRTFKDRGDVIALFPLEPATRDGWNCESYMHVGQHGAADTFICRGRTRPGMPLALESLLNADDFNFSHDVFGIRRHINRQTGQIEDCFVPRFAQKYDSI